MILNDKKGIAKIFFSVAVIAIIVVAISISLEAQNETGNLTNTTQINSTNSSIEINSSNSTGNLTNANVTSNSSVKQNETNKTSQPSPELNSSVSAPEQGQTQPEINISLSYPENVTRGKTIWISADVSNIGNSSAKFSTSWILPNGFSITNGNQKTSNNDLLSGESKNFSIEITPSISAKLGNNEIKFEVAY